MEQEVKKTTINRMLLNKIMRSIVLLALLSEGFVLFFYHGAYQTIWLSISLGAMFSSLVIFKATENNNRTHIGLWKLDGECDYTKPNLTHAYRE